LLPVDKALKVDVDVAPQAAYACEVTDVPQISVLPLGKKPDGSFHDNSDLKTVKAELGRYDQLVSTAQSLLARLKIGEDVRSSKNALSFDPATGTTY
jgi:hypothetical protein